MQLPKIGDEYKNFEKQIIVAGSPSDPCIARRLLTMIARGNKKRYENGRTPLIDQAKHTNDELRWFAAADGLRTERERRLAMLAVMAILRKYMREIGAECVWCWWQRRAHDDYGRRTAWYAKKVLREAYRWTSAKERVVIDRLALTIGVNV